MISQLIARLLSALALSVIMFVLLGVFGSSLIGVFLCAAVVGLALAALHATRLAAVDGIAGYLPARIKRHVLYVARVTAQIVDFDFEIDDAAFFGVPSEAAARRWAEATAKLKSTRDAMAAAAAYNHAAAMRNGKRLNGSGDAAGGAYPSLTTGIDIDSEPTLTTKSASPTASATSVAAPAASASAEEVDYKHMNGPLTSASFVSPSQSRVARRRTSLRSAGTAGNDDSTDVASTTPVPAVAAQQSEIETTTTAVAQTADPFQSLRTPPLPAADTQSN
jgi:hypothetical protein